MGRSSPVRLHQEAGQGQQGNTFIVPGLSGVKEHAPAGRQPVMYSPGSSLAGIRACYLCGLGGDVFQICNVCQPKALYPLPQRACPSSQPLPGFGIHGGEQVHYGVITGIPCPPVEFIDVLSTAVVKSHHGGQPCGFSIIKPGPYPVYEGKGQYLVPMSPWRPGLEGCLKTLSGLAPVMDYCAAHQYVPKAGSPESTRQVGPQVDKVFGSLQYKPRMSRQGFVVLIAGGRFCRKALQIIRPSFRSHFPGDAKCEG